MSILIKGVKMPKACYECPCQYDLISCQALDFQSICEEGFDCTIQRLPNCPLVEVKTPHGRLVDFGDIKYNGYTEAEITSLFPTVIESEVN